MRPKKNECVDAGANAGYLAIMMTALGSSVEAVEPQFRLAEIIQRSTELNCFENVKSTPRGRDFGSR